MSYWYRQRLMKSQPRDDHGRFMAADGSSFERAENLSSEDRNIETHLADQVGHHYDQTVTRYNAIEDAHGGKVLNTDVARELSPDYLKDRTKSAAVHAPASYFIKKLYAQKLQESAKPGEAPLVLFTAGGTGAGKTTAIDTIPSMKALSDKAQIVYDTNMNTYPSAKQKVEQALTAGKDVHIVAVQRDPVDALVNGALPRAMRQEQEFGSGRTVPLGEHLKTHVGVTPTLQRLADDYKDNPHVKIHAIDNSLGRGKAKEIPLSQLKTYQPGILKAALDHALEQAHGAKRISDKVYTGFKNG